MTFVRHEVDSGLEESHMEADMEYRPDRTEVTIADIVAMASVALLQTSCALLGHRMASDSWEAIAIADRE